MSRVFCSLLALTLLTLAAPPAEVKAAGSPTATISCTFTNGMSVYAQASGTPLMGSGKLNPYALRVTGGSINGRYVTMTGVIVTGNATTTFKLEGEVTTGTVRLSYKGANGKTYTFQGKGKVTIS